MVDPLNCMVGCTTCANTCPAHAIAFPSLDSVLALEARSDVRHAVEDDLLARRDVLEALEETGLLNGQRDIYVAGPATMLRALARVLDEREISKDRVHMDSFGV